MAGMALGPSASGGPPGYVWSAKHGGYVSPGTLQQDQADAAEATKPKYTTSPLGQVSKFNQGSGAWDQIGQQEGGGGGGGASTRALGSVGSGGSTGDPAIKAQMLSLMQSLQTPTPDPVAPQQGPGPALVQPTDTTATDTAARTASKERAGQRLHASTRALGNVMGARGIAGSGIEAGESEKLLADSMGQEAETDRGILAGNTARSQHLADVNAGATNQYNEHQYDAQNQYNAQVFDSRLRDKQRIQTLLGAYGMLY